MTEVKDFEDRFAESLRTYAAPAARPARREAVTKAVAAGRDPRRGGVGPLRLPTFHRLSGAVVTGTAAIAMVVVGAVLMRPAPSDTGIGGPGAAPPIGPAGNGVIALVKDGDIVVADRPGGDTRPLVAGPENDTEPMFSPDGTKLVFRRGVCCADPSILMVADADGSDIVQLTQVPSTSSTWSFAPDGRSIVFVTVLDGEKRVVVRPLDPAAAPTVLDIRMPSGWMNIVDPSFRPSNPQEVLVVAQLTPHGPRGLYVYDLATNGIRTIVEETDGQPVGLSYVAWSPTGDAITYARGDGMRVVAADGSGDRALEGAAGTLHAHPRSPWSNDGTRRVVTRDTGVGSEQHIVVSTEDDGEPIALACGPTSDIECPDSWDWSPDDSMLIGPTYRDTGGPLSLADPVTGQVTDLGWNGFEAPSWQRVAP